MPANRAMPSRPAKAMNSAGSSMRPSESIFISCALNSIVCRTSASFDRLSISSIASTIWPMRSGPHPSRQGRVSDLYIYKVLRLRSRTALKGAGTETRPLASSSHMWIENNHRVRSVLPPALCRAQGCTLFVGQRRILSVRSIW